MRVVRELVSLWKIRYRTPVSDRELFIYSEHESYYAYYEGLIAALKTTHSKPFCYVTSDPDDPILTDDDPGIHAFYLNKLLPFFMRMLSCRVFVMTLTDLHQFHIQRSVNPVHYVYVFHAMNSTHMAYRHGAFDHYDSILCTGPYQVQELERDSELRTIRKRNLIAAGYARLERINAAWKARDHKDPPQNRTVLVAPSWAASNVLEQHGENLVRTLLAADFHVIVRPHPETHKRFPKLAPALESAFAGDSRFLLERSVRTDDSMLGADVLITDWSGIALEYAFGTERPVLYIDVPRKVHNDRYKEIDIEPVEVRMRNELGIVVAPEQLDNIAEITRQLISEQQQYRDRITRLRTENVFNFGHASDVGAQYICGLLSTENQV